MLSTVTLDDANGNPVTLHQDAPTGKRWLTKATGLRGLQALRLDHRVRPAAHGGINQTRYEDGRQITLEGEIMSNVSIEDAFNEFTIVAGAVTQTLDVGPALLKWTEGNGFGYLDTVLADKPVSYWRLDEASGTVAADQTGANPATYAGGVTLGQAGALSGSGDPDAAVLLDGSSGYVSTPTLSPFNAGSTGTLEGWAKPTDFTTSLMGLMGSTNNGSASVSLNGASEFRFWPSAAAAAKWTIPALVAGQWFHWAVVYGDSTLTATLYIDGISQGQQALPGHLVAGTTGLALGMWDGGSFFWKGELDEMAVYNYSLSAAQIAAHYQAGLVLSDHHLQRLVKLDGDLDPPFSDGQAVLSYQVQLFSDDPRAYSQTLQTVTSAPWVVEGGGHTFPEPYPRTYASSGGATVTFLNAGNRPTPPIFQLYGQCVNPQIVNLNTQERLVFNGTVDPGNYLEIDCAKRTVKLGGTTNRLNFYDAANSTWFDLDGVSASNPTGATNLQLIAASSSDGNALLKVLARSAYA